MFYLSMLLIGIFYGIRYDYGNDYWNYYTTFVMCSNSLEAESSEIGWSMINYICQPIGYFGMVFILNIIETVAIYYQIKRYVSRKYWWLAILIYTCTFNFMLLGCSMMRQYLAMIILTFTIPSIVNRHLFKFILITAIATTIHQTSIIFLPVYFLSLWIPNLHQYKYIIISVCIFLCLMAFSMVYVEYFELAAMIFDDDKFMRYIYLGNKGSYTYTIAFDIAWMILLMWIYPQSKTSRVICVISLLSYFLLPFSFVVTILLRLMLFFSIYFIFSIPNMIEGLHNRYLRIGVLSLYCILLFKRTISSMTSDTYSVFYQDFKTIFESTVWL